MQWNSVPTEEPRIILAVGSVWEDNKAVYKILEPVDTDSKNKMVHKYKVEILEQKIPLPDDLRQYIDPKFQTLVILPQNLIHMKRRE